MLVKLTYFEDLHPDAVPSFLIWHKSIPLKVVVFHSFLSGSFFSFVDDSIHASAWRPRSRIWTGWTLSMRVVVVACQFFSFVITVCIVGAVCVGEWGIFCPRVYHVSLKSLWDRDTSETGSPVFFLWQTLLFPPLYWHYWSCGCDVSWTYLCSESKQCSAGFQEDQHVWLLLLMQEKKESVSGYSGW